MVPAGNKAKRLSSVNHTTKTILHHHHHHHHHVINGKTFYDQEVESNIKRYDQIRKLTTEQGEDHTTGCLLDYDYIKNHYRLIRIQKQFNK